MSTQADEIKDLAVQLGETQEHNRHISERMERHESAIGKLDEKVDRIRDDVHDIKSSVDLMTNHVNALVTRQSSDHYHRRHDDSAVPTPPAAANVDKSNGSGGVTIRLSSKTLVMIVAALGIGGGSVTLGTVLDGIGEADNVPDPTTTVPPTWAPPPGYTIGPAHEGPEEVD